ncbi:MAG: hypothetical protein KGQ46_06690 [Hyphomicrobiales bacterium]|nr:hypothetical protein [Hyphomicrobiales bacterium]MDE2113958.1 hypothetical protein [Hyphomicrobiales bacterium]
MRKFAGLLLGLLLPMGFARAEPYRFCVGVAFQEKIAYVTDIFPNSEAQNTLEAQFDRQLVQAGVPHVNVQCPYPVDRVAAFDAQHLARQFNEEMGYTVRTISIQGKHLSQR